MGRVVAHGHNPLEGLSCFHHPPHHPALWVFPSAAERPAFQRSHSQKEPQLNLLQVYLSCLLVGFYLSCLR